MAQFPNDGAHPFREVLEDDGPQPLVATLGPEGLRLHCEAPRVMALEGLLRAIHAQHPLGLEEGQWAAWGLRPVQAWPELEGWWRGFLGWGEVEALPMLQAGTLREAFPARCVQAWLSNLSYRHDRWLEARAKVEAWQARQRQALAELPAPWDWAQGAPGAEALRGLEAQALAQAGLPQPAPAEGRVAFLQGLEALGLLAPEDGGLREAALAAAGCSELRRWREAALRWRWLAPMLEGGLLEGEAPHPLTGLIGLRYFVEGPFHQQRLDPLAHLRFALHCLLESEPPSGDGGFVSSWSTGLSSHFRLELGLGGLPQLVEAGQPCPGSLAQPHANPAYATEGGDRVVELSARQIRQGRPNLGALLAAAWLERDPAHAMSWVELGVGLHEAGHSGLGRACLEEAMRLGKRLSASGELAPIFAAPQLSLPSPYWRFRWIEAYRKELPRLPEEELAAILLTRELYALPLQGLWEGLRALPLPPVAARLLAEGLASVPPGGALPMPRDDSGPVSER